MNKAQPILCISLLLLLSACASTDPVVLQDAMGRMAQCGPYTKLLGNIPLENEAAEMTVRKCVSMLEREGYELIASPVKSSSGMTKRRASPTTTRLMPASIPSSQGLEIANVREP